MTHMPTRAGAGHLPINLEQAIAEHGAWKVLVAALRALLRGTGSTRAHDARRLSDHLRRDIGIPRVDHLPRNDGFRF
ncbi:hypothetical protein [Frigidibacter sp. ROC022]|uniref:hypothetical protein n=1 Tax=Frigidibacter sp. ROC022 TaxID=2971796 RepID=UPI00215A3B39|nr:hypothetical protein [Frigidibacter sp. ROC022]MCR8726589.1 hypothetical protein [Frigidibacter sp. ROC022]